MDDKEFDRLWEKYNGRKAGEGDSPYTQELLDEMNCSEGKRRKGR